MDTKKSAREAAVADYQSELEDLSFNSKPHINVLTMLAEENAEFSKDIVKVIEDRLLRVEPGKTLPVLYLMDSIMKNVPEKGNYKEIFLQNITTIFLTVFDKVDETTRSAMFRLRNTWIPIIPEKKLYSIDKGCNSMDPAWPLLARAPGSTTPPSTPTPTLGATIHVNRKFLKGHVPASAAAKPSLPHHSSGAAAAAKAAPKSNSAPPASDVDLNEVEAQIRHSLITKQLKQCQNKFQKDLEAMKTKLEAIKSPASSGASPVASAAASPVAAAAAASKTPSKEEEELRKALDRHANSSESSSLPAGVNLRDPRIRAKAGMKNEAPSRPTADLVVGQPAPPGVPDIPTNLPQAVKPPAMKIPKKSPSETKVAAAGVQPSTPTAGVAAPVAAKSRSSSNLVNKDAAPGADETSKAAALAPFESEASFSPAVSDDEDVAGRRVAFVEGKAPANKKQRVAKTTKDKRGTNEKILADLEKQKQKLGGKVALFDLNENAKETTTATTTTTTPAPKTSKNGVQASKSGRDSKEAKIKKSSPSKKSSSSSSSSSPKKSPLSTPERKDQNSHPDRQFRGQGDRPRGDRPRDDRDSSASSPREKRSRSSSPKRSGSRSRSPKEARVTLARSPVEGGPGLSGRDQRPGSSGRRQSGAKRSVEVAKKEEPPQKKAKEDDLTNLFGTEDQDLRKFTPPSSSAAEKSAKPGVPSASSAKRELLSAFSSSLEPLIPPSLGNFAEFCGRHAVVMGPVEEQLRQGKLTAEQLKEVVAKLVDIDKATGLKDQDLRKPRDPRRRRQEVAPQVVDYGHGRRSPSEGAPKRADSPLWETRESKPTAANATASVSSPNRDVKEENDLRADALKTIGKGGHHNALPRLSMPARGGGGGRHDRPPSTPLVKEMLEEQLKDGVDPRHRMLLRNVQQMRGSRREGVGRTMQHELFIDNQTFYVRANEEARRIRFRNTRIAVRIDTENREVWFDQKLVYRIGEIPRSTVIGGKPQSVWVNGPTTEFWIDDFHFEIRFDSPPQRMPVEGEIFAFQAYSFTNELFVDNYFITTLGGAPRNILLKGSTHQIRFDPPPRQIVIDGVIREMSFEGVIPVVLVPPTYPPNAAPPLGAQKLVPHGIQFDGPPREIFVDGVAYSLPMNRPMRIKIDHRHFEAAFGGPFHEVIIDGKIFNVDFDGMDRPVVFGGKTHQLRLESPVPEVKILGPTDPENGKPIVLQHGPKKYSTSQKAAKTEKNETSTETVVAASSQQQQQQQQQSDLPLPPPPPIPPAMSSNDVPELKPPPFMSASLPASGFPNVSVPGAMPQTETAPAAAPAAPAAPLDPLSLLLPPQASVPASGGSDVTQLFEKLVAAGIINKKQQELGLNAAKAGGPDFEAQDSSVVSTNAQFVADQTPQPSGESGRELNPESKRFDEPVMKKTKPAPSLLDWDINKLKIRYDSAISVLYRGSQCSTCGVRFSSDRASAYAPHLDWHFRQFRRDQEANRKASSRKWYYALEEWIQFEEISELDEAASSSFFEGMAASNRQPAESEIVSCPVAEDREGDSACEICGEAFEQFWDEDEEEWHLKDALRIKERTYHPVCYEDFKETSILESSVVTTPSFQPPVESTPKPRRKSPSIEPPPIKGSASPPPISLEEIPPISALPPEVAMDYDDSNSSGEGESLLQLDQTSMEEGAPIPPAELSGGTAWKENCKRENSAQRKEEEASVGYEGISTESTGEEASSQKKPFVSDAILSSGFEGGKCVSPLVVTGDKDVPIVPSATKSVSATTASVVPVNSLSLPLNIAKVLSKANTPVESRPAAAASAAAPSSRGESPQRLTGLGLLSSLLPNKVEAGSSDKTTTLTTADATATSMASPSETDVPLVLNVAAPPTASTIDSTLPREVASSSAPAPTQTGVDLMAALLAGLQRASGVGALPSESAAVESPSGVSRERSPNLVGASATSSEAGGVAPTSGPLTLSVGGLTLTIPAGAVLTRAAQPSGTTTKLQEDKATEDPVGERRRERSVTPTLDEATPTLDETNPFDG